MLLGKQFTFLKHDEKLLHINLVHISLKIMNVPLKHALIDASLLTLSSDYHLFKNK